MMRNTGAYLPHVDEEISGVEKGTVLTDKKSLHLRASTDFTDIYGVKRRAGDEWLVGHDMAEVHIKDVHETVIGTENIISLTNRQYCVVMNPVGKEGKVLFGEREIRKREMKFFLQPGELLLNGIQDVKVLGEDEALLLKAAMTFKDDEGAEHKAGETWMIQGPCEYIPPIEVDVLKTIKSFPLNENEGVYVKDKQTGEVHMVKGPQTYMLASHEELWEKQLTSETEELLMVGGFIPSEEDEQGNIRYKKLDTKKVRKRRKTDVVTFKAPHNTAVQLFDFKNKKERVVYGPDLVMLEPYEELTLITLSGGIPK